MNPATITFIHLSVITICGVIGFILGMNLISAAIGLAIGLAIAIIAYFVWGRKAIAAGAI